MPYPVDGVATALGRASAVYAAEGLTHVVEAGIGLGLLGRTPVEGAAYLLARERGLLRTRVELMVASDTLHPLRAHPDDDLDVGLDLGLRTGFGDDRLRLGPMKIWLDGSLIGRTAALSEPFCDHGTAVLQGDPDEMRRLVVDAHRAGWRVAAHAIGDDAVELALDTFAEAAPRPPAQRRPAPHRARRPGPPRPAGALRRARRGARPAAALPPRHRRHHGRRGRGRNARTGSTGTARSWTPGCACPAAPTGRSPRCARCSACSPWSSG